MNMNPESFQQLLEIHGGDSRNWPASEREQALAWLRGHPDAQAMLAEAQQLDHLLQDIAEEYRMTDLAALQQRILSRELPDQPAGLLQQLENWLLPNRLQSFWRPALAACLPLVFGLYLGSYFSFGINEVQNNWEEELVLLSLSDYAEDISGEL